MFIIYFYKLDFGKLFEVRHERARNSVKRSVRLTIAREIHVRDAIGEGEFGIACEAIEHEG